MISPSFLQTEHDPKRCIAFFDFDGTLATRDSLWPFLVQVVGVWPCVRALIYALMTAPLRKDGRTAIKERLLRKLLSGVRRDALGPGIDALKKWVVWIEPSVAALKEHHALGHHVVIASGSLGVYLPALLEGLPYDGLLCTEIGEEGGILTGEMVLGNCVRKRKAERVRGYLEKHGPFGESWAYGNAPHDLPMMEVCDHRVVV